MEWEKHVLIFHFVPRSRPMEEEHALDSRRLIKMPPVNCVVVSLFQALLKNLGTERRV